MHAGWGIGVYFLLVWPVVDGVSLESKFRRLFELAEIKLITVANMKLLGWGVNGEAWKWRMRVFEWEEMVREYIDRLFNVILQVEMEDRWVWKLDSSKRYPVKSAYDNLTSIKVDFNLGSNHVLWLKMIRLNLTVLLGCCCWTRFQLKIIWFCVIFWQLLVIFALLIVIVENRDHSFY